MKQVQSLTFLIALIFLTGCSVTVPVTGYDFVNDEVYQGTVTMSFLDGTGSASVTGEESGIRASGVAGYKFGAGSRRGGFITLDADDGRHIEGSWTTTGMTSGRGTGEDRSGNRFAFVFGNDESERNKFVEQQKRLKESGVTSGVASVPPSRDDASQTKKKREGHSAGTGFFVAADGHLVTNYHVVKGASHLTVIDQQGREYNASLVAGSQDNDLALLKVDAAAQPLSLSHSRTPAKGGEVLTLGYPLVQLQGQEQKATFGRINSLTGVRGDVRFVQIDVPVQPGNSGGPLLDRNGHVIGVITASLNQIATLVVSGSLPQNVNYALKVEYVKQLCEGVISIDSAVETNPQSAIEMSEVIRRSQSSIVQVIAR